ncbi:alpha/beta hydrolase [Corallococcus exiguus]|uniref:alpha/beta hydrolase n=1 Tax=Corallococcus exiguus TaxID=83462 RepID=UPI00149453DC|nr:alpha/beta hydrolase-fold protein [Corallococcus exiguus]NPD27570.1 alpha/beta hydrolase [Corallococcus exiguus]
MGYVHILRHFPSPQEGFNRTVRIYTPDAYDSWQDHRFPVLYMHDGQNVFAHPESAVFDTWCANRVAEESVQAGRMEPWIIVAVDSGPGRFQEYSPWDEPRNGVSARGEAYGRFLVEELKPYIDRTYRTRQGSQWTGAMGSSLGGLISLYLGWKFPQVFGRIGALSPTVMWSQGRLFDAWREHSQRWTRIYLDAGATESIHAGGLPLDYGRGTRDFFHHLKGLGYGDHEVSLVLEPGGEHHEKDWQRRLPGAMQWLLG